MISFLRLTIALALTIATSAAPSAIEPFVPHAPGKLNNAVATASLSTAAASLGYLQCHSLATGRIFGYVRNAYNSYGEYIGVNPSTIPSDVAARLLVRVDLAAGGEGPVNVGVQNAPSRTYPFFGAVAGENGPNLGNNHSYVFVVGTGDESTPGSAPSLLSNSFTQATGKRRKAASAVWKFNATSGEVKPTWINEDGNAVDVTVGYLNGAFAMTGNTTAFEKYYDDEDVTWLKFVFSTN